MKHERKTIQSNQSNQDKMTQSVKCLDLKCGSMYVEGEGGGEGERGRWLKGGLWETVTCDEIFVGTAYVIL